VKTRHILAYALLVNAAALAVSETAGAASFTVTSSAAAGPGSLADALQRANATSNNPLDVPDRIVFDLAGVGTHVIAVASTLTITDPVDLDGYSQNGARRNTLAGDNDAILGIEVDCRALSPLADCVHVQAPGSRVSGLSVVRSPGAGVRLSASAAGTRIDGNFVGVTAARVAAGNAGNGVRVDQGAQVVIGGASAAEQNVIRFNGLSGAALQGGGDSRVLGNVVTDNAGDGLRVINEVDAVVQNNLLSGNGGNGVLISGGANVWLRANLIGVDPRTESAVPNGLNGVSLEGDTRNARIGGEDIADGNIISGNTRAGIDVDESIDELVQNNRIGSDRSGEIAVGNAEAGISANHESTDFSVWSHNLIVANGSDGIRIGESGREILITDNRIGLSPSGLERGNGRNGIFVDSHTGLVRVEMNTIAHCQNAGIAVDRFSAHVMVSRNALDSNGGLGIDLEGPVGPTPNDPDDSDTGGNGLQNFPVLQRVRHFADGSGQIQGELVSTAGRSFRLEVFASTSRDPTGFGEGGRFIADATTLTDAAGRATFVIDASQLLPGSFVAATATDVLDRASSEFSASTLTEGTGGMVRGLVFDDVDGNGQRGASETGLAGVTIYLDDNSNGQRELDEEFLITGTDGAFSLLVRENTASSLRQVTLPGRRGTTVEPVPVQLSGASEQAGTLFGQQLLPSGGTAAGVVFDDVDGDGLRDPGELGLAAVSVFDDANANTTADPDELAAVTGADGSFILLAGSDIQLNLRQIALPGRIKTTPEPVALELAGGGQVAGVVLGQRLAPAGGSVTGVVFDDADGDGARDAGEAGLQNMTVFDDANQNAALDPGEASASSVSGGIYTIAIPADRTLRLRLLPTPDRIQTTPIVSLGIAGGIAIGGIDIGSHSQAPGLATVRTVPGPRAGALILMALALLGLGSLGMQASSRPGCRT
jgi:hypothetical protein